MTIYRSYSDYTTRDGKVIESLGEIYVHIAIKFN